MCNKHWIEILSGRQEHKSSSGFGMEKSIDKKKPRRKDEIKVEQENVDPAPELVDTAQVDDERAKFWLKKFKLSTERAYLSTNLSYTNASRA